MPSLLPPNATAEEQAVAEAMGRISDIPVVVDALYNPQTCPAALLPWLAWAMGVDAWSASWSEAQKRRVIAASCATHKTKGTRGALQRALDALGYRIYISEWFEHGGDPYTFRVTVELSDRGVDASTYTEIRRLIDVAKNVRSHLDGLTVATRIDSALKVGLTAMAASSVTIAPYTLAGIDSNPAGQLLGVAPVIYQIVHVEAANA